MSSTRIIEAVINVDTAGFSIVSVHTCTCKLGDSIDAETAVLTWVTRALINVILTVRSIKAIFATAIVVSVYRSLLNTAAIVLAVSCARQSKPKVFCVCFSLLTQCIISHSSQRGDFLLNLGNQTDFCLQG